MRILENLPIEEALEYHDRCDDGLVRSDIRQTTYITKVGGFADYVLGMCPIRQSPSIWLVDERGKFWTARQWCEGGEIAEGWDNTKISAFSWPINPNKLDYTHLLHILSERWGEVGHSLILEEFGETCIGLWNGMSNYERRVVRALMIYGFDMEYGKGAFARSVNSAKLKHRRAVSRTKKKIRVEEAIGAQ